MEDDEVKAQLRIVDLDEPCLVTPENAERMRSRVVVLAPGEETGEHETSHREEILVVLEGRITMISPSEERGIDVGQAVYVPRSTRHNVINRTDDTARYIYVLALHMPYEDIKAHGKH